MSVLWGLTKLSILIFNNQMDNFSKTVLFSLEHQEKYVLNNTKWLTKQLFFSVQIIRATTVTSKLNFSDSTLFDSLEHCKHCQKLVPIHITLLKCCAFEHKWASCQNPPHSISDQQAFFQGTYHLTPSNLHTIHFTHISTLSQKVPPPSPPPMCKILYQTLGVYYYKCISCRCGIVITCMWSENKWWNCLQRGNGNYGVMCTAES